MPNGQRDNHERAEAALAALEAYIATNTSQYRDEPIEDQVGDLLCDLMHLVRRDGTEGEYIDGKRHNDADPTDLLDRARLNFEEEEEEENGGEEGTEDDEDEDEQLRCTTDTPEMHDEILADAREVLERTDLQANFEHGHWWVTARETGAQWAVVDVETTAGEPRFDYEQVTEGEDEDAEDASEHSDEYPGDEETPEDTPSLEDRGITLGSYES